jgi:hypothetical protein
MIVLHEWKRIEEEDEDQIEGPKQQLDDKERWRY